MTVAGTLEAGTTTTAGTLFELGNLSFTSTGTFSTRLTGPGVSDQVIVLGNLDLTAEPALVVTPLYTASPGDNFLPLRVQGGQTFGKFANLPDGAVDTVSGQKFIVNYPGGTFSGVELTATVPTGPYVAGVQINDGSMQRSELDWLTVTFSGPVNFAGGNANAAAAFQLNHVQTGNNVILSTAVSTNGSSQTVVTLTFSSSNPSTEVDPVSELNGGGPYPTGGLVSLADGRYTLTILSADVTDANGANLAGDGMSAGSNYVSGTDSYEGHGPRLYRLFGDVTGDGVVDATDLGEFRAAFDTFYGQQMYQWYMDADNSGAIDAQDIGQFRARYNYNVF